MVEYWDGTGVTVQQLKAEIIRLGKEFPDKVVKCVYSENDEPVCIVGQAVFNLTGKIVHNDTWFGQIDSSRWIKALGGNRGVEQNWGFSDEDFKAFTFIERAQWRQDHNDTWSEAVRCAREIEIEIEQQDS